MRLRGTRALALSQGLSSCPARPKSATGHGARLTLSARSRHSRTTALPHVLHALQKLGIDKRVLSLLGCDWSPAVALM